MGGERRIITHSPLETMEWGKEFGRGLGKGSLVTLYGDLAAGKTTLIKGIAEGALGIAPEEVVSPTFVYLNIYRGNPVPDHESFCYFGCVKAPGLEEDRKKGRIDDLIQPFSRSSNRGSFHATQNSENFRGRALVLYHFDLYRLREAGEFFSLGFEEYLQGEGICCIEWSEKIHAYLPKERIHISLTHLGGDRREITLSYAPFSKP